MKKITCYLGIGQSVKSLRGSDRGFDCRLTVVRPERSAVGRSGVPAV